MERLQQNKKRTQKKCEQNTKKCEQKKYKKNLKKALTIFLYGAIIKTDNRQDKTEKAH